MYLYCICISLLHRDLFYIDCSCIFYSISSLKNLSRISFSKIFYYISIEHLLTLNSTYKIYKLPCTKYFPFYIMFLFLIFFILKLLFLSQFNLKNINFQ